MATKDDLKAWVADAIQRRGGDATILEVAKLIWNEYEHELRQSGDLFYTWQYDMRWAATKLRHQGVLAPAEPGQPWRLES